jgi:hypothetical protein
MLFIRPYARFSQDETEREEREEREEMPGDANVAAIAGVLADPTRVGILMVLLDGRALPAGDKGVGRMAKAPNRQGENPAACGGLFLSK